MTGYGASPWGAGPYGSLPATLGVSSAFAVSTHEIVVELTKPPLDVSGFVVGDVRNPRSWDVTVPATGQVLDVAGTAPYERPLRWLVRTLQRLPDSLGVGRVSIAGRPSPGAALRDAARGVAQGPMTADFVGVTELAISTPQKLADSRARTGRDLANVPVPQVSDTNVGGTLSIVGGDYALVDGADLIRKLVVRRLTTTPGEFFHIPSYGVGLAVKQPLPGGAVVRLKKRVEQQVLLEPEVSSVAVAVSQTLTLLTITVKVASIRTGQQVTVALNSPIGQG